MQNFYKQTKTQCDVENCNRLMFECQEKTPAATWWDFQKLKNQATLKHYLT